MQFSLLKVLTPITDIIRDIQVGSSIKDNDAIITGCDSDDGNINMHILDDLSSYLQILIPLVIGLSPASRSSDSDMTVTRVMLKSSTEKKLKCPIFLSTTSV